MTGESHYITTGAHSLVPGMVPVKASSRHNTVISFTSLCLVALITTLMASGYPLPPPPPLDIHGTQAADNWKKFKRAWTNFSLAIELNKKPEPVQVTTLLTVIGEEAREVFATFTGWAEEGDDAKIVPVLGKFAAYCEPRKSVPFERYRFNKRAQEPGESYEQYRTTLRKLSESCEFQSITPDEIRVIA